MVVVVPKLNNSDSKDYKFYDVSCDKYYDFSFVHYNDGR